MAQKQTKMSRNMKSDLVVAPPKPPTKKEREAVAKFDKWLAEQTQPKVQKATTKQGG